MLSRHQNREQSHSRQNDFLLRVSLDIIMTRKTQQRRVTSRVGRHKRLNADTEFFAAPIEHHTVRSRRRYIQQVMRGQVSNPRNVGLHTQLHVSASK